MAHFRVLVKAILFVLLATALDNVSSNKTKTTKSKSSLDAADSPKQQQHQPTHTTHLQTSHAQNNSEKHTTAAKCLRPDIEQFPSALFGQTVRRHGGVVFHFLVAIYMFIGLAIVCDDFFVPSLEMICKLLNLKGDVAGATFMAAGSSAPELASSMVSLFIAKDVDIGIGTVVGSAVFNIMFVIGIVCLLSGMIITVHWYSITRDAFFYLVSILAMILVIGDEKVHWYEAVFFIILYVIYIAILMKNDKVESWAMTHLKFLRRVGILEGVPLDTESYQAMENEKSMNDLREIEKSFEIDSSNGGGPEAEEFGRANLEKEAPEAISLFKLPGADKPKNERIKFFVFWPLMVLVHYSIPDCKQPKWQKFFALTFFMSMLWLCLFSYIMVWMITIIGYTFSIPDSVMGITFIAFGASVPDALGSLLVAKSGHGDMAVSNAIGSNVFDILICLGVPWLLKCLFISGDFILVKSKGLIYSSIQLFATVLILMVAIRFNNWQLDKKLGIFLLIVYFVFIILSSLYEMNIFGSNHLPMCLDSLW